MPISVWVVCSHFRSGLLNVVKVDAGYKMFPLLPKEYTSEPPGVPWYVFDGIQEVRNAVVAGLSPAGAELTIR